MNDDLWQFTLPTALYRLYDADGVLLYIGITENLKARFKQHKREKRWWGDVATKTITWYDNRAEAEDAETAAINAENPVHNIIGTPRHSEMARAAAQQREAEYRARVGEQAPGWSYRHLFPPADGQ